MKDPEGIPSRVHLPHGKQHSNLFLLSCENLIDGIGLCPAKRVIRLQERSTVWSDWCVKHPIGKKLCNRSKRVARFRSTRSTIIRASIFHSSHRFQHLFSKLIITCDIHLKPQKTSVHLGAQYLSNHSINKVFAKRCLLSASTTRAHHQRAFVPPASRCYHPGAAANRPMDPAWESQGQHQMTRQHMTRYDKIWHVEKGQTQGGMVDKCLRSPAIKWLALGFVGNEVQIRVGEQGHKTQIKSLKASLKHFYKYKESNSNIATSKAQRPQTISDRYFWWIHSSNISHHAS